MASASPMKNLTGLYSNVSYETLGGRVAMQGPAKPHYAGANPVPASKNLVKQLPLPIDKKLALIVMILSKKRFSNFYGAGGQKKITGSF